MRRNPASIAWTVLLSSFFVCVFLTVSVPLGTRWFVLHADVERPAVLRVTRGTVLLVSSKAGEPIAVIDSRQVEEGTQIQTDQSSQAALVFPLSDAPDSPAPLTVQIYPNARVRLSRSDQPRYGLSKDPDQIVLDVLAGRVRVNTTDLRDQQPRGLQSEVRTPQATVKLGIGSYAVDVTNDQAQVTARLGEALVFAAGEQTVIGPGESSTVLTGEGPGEAVASVDDLINDGDFAGPLGPPNWLVGRYPEDDPSAGNVEITTASGRQAARFYRLNQPPAHTETGITQVLERSVSDYEYLSLQMDVLLRWQSLSGAGEQSSEFPLMFWIDYEDIYGNHQFWTYGFYYRDPPEKWVVTGGQKIQPGLWYPFESGNLFERLPLEGRPPPATINWIKVYASGHNYDSLVSEVRLIAR